MAKVHVCNVIVLDNPSPFLNPFQFEITFECIEDLPEDLEWKIIYVCSAESEEFDRGLLDKSTARYFYKRLKTSLHKPRGNFLENLFSKKCALKNNLQLLANKFLSQTNTTPKNGILLNKISHFQESSIFQ